ncbi:hypothetical protein IQ07DRAFT_357205 [Pyrenochaeta sp. DS3sAY3a]|nr:hypothetical protein IQ07DRAFT_357205 [Pyrenochaeta sp. DS3sAY3a]
MEAGGSSWLSPRAASWRKGQDFVHARQNYLFLTSSVIAQESPMRLAQVRRRCSSCSIRLRILLVPIQVAVLTACLTLLWRFN